MLAELLNNCPIGVAIVSDDLQRRLYANPKLAEMFGAETPESMLVDPLDKSWCDVERFKHMQAFMQTGQDLENFIAKRKRADGSEIWVSMNSQRAEVDGRKAIIMWHDDVTELVTALRERTNPDQPFKATA